MSITTLLLHVVPRNLASALFGMLAEARLPRPVLVRLIDAFATRYGVDLSELDRAKHEFRTFGEFFARPLPVGARTFGEGVVSPVDGEIVQITTVSKGRLLQAKGREYTLEELLVDSNLAREFEGGTALTIYLAPHNYHRIHAPCDLELEELILVPGTLWPVNSMTVTRIEKVFARNERAILSCRTPSGSRIALVAVGAFNVGSIRFPFNSLATNRFGRRVVTRQKYSRRFAVGEEVARFHLGSTVILIFERGAVSLPPSLKLEEVRLGHTLGAVGPGRNGGMNTPH